MRLPRIWQFMATALLAMQLAAPAPARAQSGWDASPTVLSGVPVAIILGGQGPRIAMSAGGDAVAVWTEVPSLTTYRIVQTASYEKARDAWTPATTLFASATQATQDVDLAGDAAGNAIAVWSAPSPGNSAILALASRYSSTTRTWTDLPLPMTSPSAVPVVAMNAAGDAVIAWRQLAGANAGVHVVRYSNAAGTWSGVERPAGSSVEPALLDVAIDDGGNMQLVWRASSTIRAARFSAAAAAWESAVDLGPYTDIYVAEPHVAMNSAGHAVATWESGGEIQAVLRSPADAAWSAPIPISSGGGLLDLAQPAIDPSGAIVVAWRRASAFGTSGVQARRYVPGGGWSTIANLFNDGFRLTPSVAVAVDASGNAFVVATRDRDGTRLLAARYAANSGTWTTTPNLTPALQTAALSGVAVDPAGNAVALWFQADGNQITQALRWDAAPAVPSIVDITPSPRSVSVNLTLPPSQDPALVATNLEYSVDGGSSWTSRAPADVASPLVVPTTDDVSTYALRVRARNAAGAGRPTPPLPVRSGNGGTPSPLRVVSVLGNAVTLAWTRPAAGIEATDYLLEGGVAPQQTLASVRLGTAMTLTTVSGAPTGAFYLRLTAMNGAVRGGTSNEVRVVVGVPEAPAAPTGLTGLVNGSTLTLSWTNVTSGSSPSSLLLHVAGALSGSALLPIAESFSFANVPPGTYTFTITAMNAAGSSVPTNPVTLTFPGPCSGPPSPPSAVSASVAGNVLSLTWEPPQTGPAIGGYELVVTGAFVGRVPVSSRTVSGAIGAGLYRIGVAALNACGSSSSTAPITVVVP